MTQLHREISDPSPPTYTYIYSKLLMIIPVLQEESTPLLISTSILNNFLRCEKPPVSATLFTVNPVSLPYGLQNYSPQMQTLKCVRSLFASLLPPPQTGETADRLSASFTHLLSYPRDGIGGASGSRVSLTLPGQPQHQTQEILSRK